MKKIIYIAAISMFFIVSLFLIIILNKNTDHCLKEKLETNYKLGEVYTYCIRGYTEDLLKDLENGEEIIKYNDGAELIKTRRYNYLICKNKDIYIGSKKFDYQKSLCKK